MFSKKLRNQIVELYEQGFRGTAISDRLILNPNRCKEYCLTIELFGKEAFFDMAGTKTKYAYETNLAALKANLSGLQRSNCETLCSFLPSCCNLCKTV